MITPREPSAYGSAHILRSSQLEPITDLYYDTVLPQYKRTNYLVIASGAQWDTPVGIRRIAPPIPAEDFVVGLLELPPGGGGALHRHPTCEAFFVLGGECTFYWGEQAAQESVLRSWDVISFSAGEWLGFRNDSTEKVQLLGVLGGAENNRAIFHPRIIKEVEAAMNLNSRQ